MEPPFFSPSSNFFFLLLSTASRRRPYATASRGHELQAALCGRLAMTHTAASHRWTGLRRWPTLCSFASHLFSSSFPFFFFSSFPQEFFSFPFFSFLFFFPRDFFPSWIPFLPRSIPQSKQSINFYLHNSSISFCFKKCLCNLPSRS